MTNEEKEKAIGALKISTPVMAMTQEKFNDYIQTLNKIMDCIEQEPICPSAGIDCEDCPAYEPSSDRAVSLNAVLSEIGRWIGYLDDDMIMRIQTGIKRLPPVTLQRPKGKWINGNYHIRCSECGEDYPYRLRNFCPNCGARMEGAG